MEKIKKKSSLIKTPRMKSQENKRLNLLNTRRLNLLKSYSSDMDISPPIHPNITQRNKKKHHPKQIIFPLLTHRIWTLVLLYIPILHNAEKTPK